MSARLRVGIVGARRVRQGLGPFVARDLTRAGAHVARVLGTTPETAAEAAREVERATGSLPAAFDAVDDFFDGASIDAVCVLSPAGTHGAFLERALGAGLHVLCEKPLLWTPEVEWTDRARHLEDRFAERGLVLAENAQWPRVLPSFEALFGASTKGARELAMGLAPASLGRTMIGDALPHPLSVAQALHPSLEAAEAVTFEHPTAGTLRIAARLVGEGARLELSVELVGDSRRIPREAWLAVDGRRADRDIRAEDYALFLRSEDRSIDLPDPLTIHVADFAHAAAEARPGEPLPPDRTLSRRAALLHAITAAYDARPS